MFEPSLKFETLLQFFKFGLRMNKPWILNLDELTLDKLKLVFSTDFFMSATHLTFWTHE